jgi:hypothetical protein
VVVPATAGRDRPDHASLDPAAPGTDNRPEAGPHFGGRIRPTTIEYVTLPDSPAVPRQRTAEPAAANGHTWHEATQAHPVVAASGREVFEMAPDGDGADRTPNGLRKRNSGARRSGAAAPARAAEAVPSRAPERPSAVDDSPAEVRARLTALRAGMQRGRSEQPPPTATMSPRTGNEVERSSHER